MKVITIQGLIVQKPIVIPVRVFKLSELMKAFQGGKLKEYEKDEIFIDKFIFVDREKLIFHIENI